MVSSSTTPLQSGTTNSDNPHPSSPVEHIVPFTTGLAGVNITVDKISSHSLWVTISFLFLVIISVRTAQRGNAHLRHIMSLSTSSADRQTYWTKDQTSFWPSIKKKLLYAPLNKKRHNREMQLSKAINVGTIPSRLHTLLLSLYLISNIVYCCLLNYRVMNRAALVAEIRGRTGHLAVVNMVGLFVLAGRNNPLIGLLHVSFDTFNLFHRWIGRIIILQSIAHTIAWAVNKHNATGSLGISEAFRSDHFLQSGLVGTIAMIIILFQSPSAIRHAFYETFLHIHQFLAFAALLGVYYHAKLGPLPQMPYVIAIIVLWSYDRFARWFHIIYRNVSLRRGITTVTVEALPGEACRVTFDLRRPWRYKPGCHVYVYLPSISFWQSHPFSVAWSESRSTPYLNLERLEKLPTSSLDLGSPSKSRTTTSVSLVISKRTGMTAKLYNRASASPTGILHLKGFLEGPYGGLESLHSYGTVLLFAGGVGITHQLGHVRDLISGYANSTTATRRIILVWTVRTTEQLEWVRPWMDTLLSMPGRRDVLQVELFITKPKSPREIHSPSGTVQMHAGRVKVGVIVEKEFRNRIGAMCVGVCGPGALADDVRQAAREVVEEGKVDFWEEGFTW